MRIHKPAIDGSDRRQSVRPLPGEADEPVFAEPWQAQVLALAYSLVEDGRFAAADWAQTLGVHLQKAVQSGRPDTKETYYDCALSALEDLTAKHTEISAEDVKGREDAWRHAYLNTPHGQPVELSAVDKT